MAEVCELSTAERDFLQPYLPKAAVTTTPSGETSNDNGVEANSNAAGARGEYSKNGMASKPFDLPFVTLTYASSLDSMISLAPGLRTTLSGPETKSMTHYLRTKHDAILVGVGTAIPDDPGLNSRYPGADLSLQPTPVIIDPHGRWNSEGSKLMRLARNGEGKAPWFFHLPRSSHDGLPATFGERVFVPRAEQSSGFNDGKDTNSSSRFEWIDILKTLKRRGVESVMIEGGANIISTLLGSPELIDSVIITIAPTWLGVGGVVVSPESKTADGEKVNAARLHETSWRQFGNDAVLCGRLGR